MEFPVEITIGKFHLSAHLLLEVLAFFCGFRYYLFLRKAKGDIIAENKREWIFIGATAGAFLGSRLLGVLESPLEWFESKTPLIHLFASKTVVGALLGGLIGVECMKTWIGEKRRSGNLFTYPVILGMIIGRAGCFLNGIHEPTYGLPTSLFTCMDLGDGICRHPVALYEILFLLLLWGTLIILEKRFMEQEGLLFRVFMITYLGFRFLLEFIKPRVPLLLQLSAIQIACTGGLLYYRHTILTLIFKKEKANEHG